MRAVADVNVLISAVLSAQGPPAEILRRSRDGEFELIVSALLIAELVRALGYPKLRTYVPATSASAYVSWVRDHGTLAEDPSDAPPVRSPDPNDDYLIALAISRRAFLITGDRHLLGLQGGLPILTPAEFLRELHHHD